jgi:hypothetical protein
MRQDEAATVATLKDCREAMASLIKHYSGRVWILRGIIYWLNLAVWWMRLNVRWKSKKS